jgi:hypothetical protein
VVAWFAEQQGDGFAAESSASASGEQRVAGAAQLVLGVTAARTSQRAGEGGLAAFRRRPSCVSVGQQFTARQMCRMRIRMGILG